MNQAATNNIADKNAPPRINKPVRLPNQKKAQSGAAMDRVVTPKKWVNQRLLMTVLAVLVLAALAWFMQQQMQTRTLTVDQNRVSVGTVIRGVFEDIIPVRGRIEPAQTVFLDAVEGGRVEAVEIESGEHVTAETLLIKLSNPSLQLEVLGNEARVAEQLNAMRSLELSLEQNRLEHKRNLANTAYQIKMLTRQVAREEALLKQSAIAESTLLDTRDTLDWHKQQHDLILESQSSDARMQEAQLVFLRDTTSRLQSNLEISRQNLENMNVRAPVEGVLSGFDVQVGQSIARGERIGQIDTPDNFKLTANIDEFYLDRVTIGQVAQYKERGGEYELAVRKIYPQVQNGQFRVDFNFVAGQPEGIRRGQSLQTRLALGDASDAVLLPNGNFYQDTGGNWVFVVNDDNAEAVRRNVRLGRRNADYIEVIEGLEPGDRVVLSSYSGYLEMDRLALNQ